MGLFDYVKKWKPTSKTLGYAQMLNGFGSPVFSQFGNDVFNSDVVQQIVSCIAWEMKKLDPQHIRVNRETGDVESVEDEIQAVLRNPNQLMTTSDMIEKVIRLLYANTNAFILPTWDRHSGKLDGLYPLQPAQVEFLQDARNRIFVKFTFNDGYECTMKYEDVIHIRYNYFKSEFMGGNEAGEPDHKALLKTLKLNQTMLEGVGKALESSFQIQGIVKYNTILDDGKTEAEVQKMTDRLRNNESGFMGLDLKTEFTPFERKIALVDSTTLKFVDEKILRHFGVPLCILTGDYSKEQYESFFQKCLEPLIKSISEAFTKTLFSRRESVGFGHRIVFYSKELIFMTTQQKLEMVKELSMSGAIFENEKRTIFGLKPLPELVGVRRMSLNYVDVEIANEYQLGQYSKTKEEPEEKEPEPEEEPDEQEETEQEVEENDEEEEQSE